MREPVRLSRSCLGVPATAGCRKVGVRRALQHLCWRRRFFTTVQLWSLPVSPCCSGGSVPPERVCGDGVQPLAGSPVARPQRRLLTRSPLHQGRSAKKYRRFVSGAPRFFGDLPRDAGCRQLRRTARRQMALFDTGSPRKGSGVPGAARPSRARRRVRHHGRLPVPREPLRVGRSAGGRGWLCRDRAAHLTRAALLTAPARSSPVAGGRFLAARSRGCGGAAPRMEDGRLRAGRKRRPVRCGSGDCRRGPAAWRGLVKRSVERRGAAAEVARRRAWWAAGHSAARALGASGRARRPPVRRWLLPRRRIWVRRPRLRRAVICGHVTCRRETLLFASQHAQ